MKITPVDESDLGGRSVERLRCLQAAEAAADNDDSMNRGFRHDANRLSESEPAAFAKVCFFAYTSGSEESK